MNKPLISVIIPMYNAEKTILPCIQSVIEQTYSNKEIIVVDDGSKDSSPDIVKTIPNVLLVSQENAGPGSARNTGIRAAHGEWIAFIDSDEAWQDREKLSKQIEFNTRYDLAISGIGKKTRYSLALISLALKNVFATSTILVKKDILIEAGLFTPNKYYSEDYELWLNILAHKHRAGILQGSQNIDLAGRALYSSGGLSGNLKKMQKGEEENFTILFKKKSFSKNTIINTGLYYFILLFSRLKYIRRVCRQSWQ